MILFALLAVAAQPVESPRRFMEQLYANYGHSDYSPFTHADRVFAPRLLAAINEDSRLAHGEVGYLDGDPVCQCQDTGGMRPAIASVKQVRPGTLSHSMVPRCWAMKVCEIVRPSPVPPSRAETSGKKMRSRISSGMPGPLSSTETAMASR